MEDDVRNLRDETVALLDKRGKTTGDVRWVGNHDGTLALSWVEFAALANRTYDSGFGGHEVALALVVVGDDWWLERWEYDGSEGWTYQTLPQRQPDAQPFKSPFEYGREYVRTFVPRTD